MKWNFHRKNNKEQENIPEPDLTNPDNALRHVLGSLHDCLQTPDRVEGDRVFCPDWQMTITPEITQVDERGAVVNFYISAPQWGKDLFECSAGMGSDTKQALGMACGSFLFSFMDGIVQMESGQTGESLKTEFAGKAHRWKVYLSNIVGMGNSPQIDNPRIYWDALKEEVVKRLGNQKLCFVKVYASKSGENITAECRVDDIKSEVLSNIVADMVKDWDACYFASHKAFFFIRQEEETVQPYPYLGQAGWEALREKVRTAALMFHASRDQEQYESLPERLKQALGDAILAAECYSFLPEICAENAFCQKITFAETVDILLPNGEEFVTCYKSQLADYWPLHGAIFSLFEEGAFGDATNDIYQEYIGVSAIYSVICQAREKGGEKAMEGGTLSALLFNVGSDFEIR